MEQTFVKSLVFGASCACLLTCMPLPASSATINVGAIDGGWYRSDGLHRASFDNYLAGESGGTEHRNWFAFDLSSVTLQAGEVIAGATLSLQNGGYGGDENEQWTVISVESDFSSVMTGHLAGSDTGKAIFNDLKDGNIYARSTISSTTPRDEIIAVSFTSINSISDITSSIGGLFAVGGYVSSLDSPSDEFLFSGTAGRLGSVNLVLETAAVPVPPAIWLFGSGLLGLIGISRRKKAPEHRHT